MSGRLYRGDPLSPRERDEHELDLVAFSDRELDLIGDIRGQSVLYAGGKSPLWIEGLAERIGEDGSLTVLDEDEAGLARAEAAFSPDDLPIIPRFVAGDVFDPPFRPGSFDLAYSAGLFHELDVRGREDGALECLWSLRDVVVPGGRLAGSDFVSDVEAAQTEDEAIEADIARLATGVELFGIGVSRRILDKLTDAFELVAHSLHSPFGIRHLDKLFLAEDDPPELDALDPLEAERLRRRRKRLRKRVEVEGYTRPATLFFDVTVRGGSSLARH